VAKPIMDDFSGELLDAEFDKVYNLSVTTRVTDTKGKQHFVKLELDIGHKTLNELVLSKFEAKKIKFKEWLNPTEEEIATSTKLGKTARGTWAPFSGAF